MAELDPNIILGVKPVQIADPMEGMARAYQLKNLGLQNQAAQQDYDDDQTIRALAAQHTTPAGNIDTPSLLKDIYAHGLYKKGSALEQQQLGVQKTRADIGETEAKTGQANAATQTAQYALAKQKSEALDNVFGGLLSNPNLGYQDIQSAVHQAANSGLIDPTAAAAIYAKIPDNLHPAQYRQMVLQEAQQNQSIGQYLDNQIKQAPQLKDTGGQLTAIDPLTGKPTGATIGKTMTPGEASTASTAKAKLDWEKSGGLNDDAKDLMAERLLQGEPASKVLSNLGRGAQGAQDLRAVQNLVAQKARERGIDAAGVLSATQGVVADTRTASELGAREGKVAPRVKEAQNFATMALDASNAVPRGNWSGLNKLLQAGASQASDPALARFQAANTSLINAYAAAVGGGQVTVAGQEHARQMLSTAQGPEAYKAVVDQILKETQGALDAPGQVKQRLGIGGKASGAPPSAGNGAQPSLNAIFGSPQ